MAKSETIIFQASDLNRHGRAVLDRARSEPTRLRDTDGLGIIIAAESAWAERDSQADRMSRIIGIMALYLSFRTAQEDPDWDPATGAERLGAWAWLRSLPQQDIREFSDEVRLGLLDSFSSRDPAVLETLIEDWRETSIMAADPESRRILSGPFDTADYVEVDRPGEE